MATKDEIIGREQWILKELLKNGRLKVGDVCSKFKISVATARRDLETLERHGRLRRTYGGAVSVEPLLAEAFGHVTSYWERVERFADEKRRIGMAAAELISDGDTIALSPGTTTIQIMRALHGRKSITAVTNSLNLAMELCSRPGVNLFVTGGFLHSGWFSLLGQQAIDAMRSVFADKVFLSATGFDAEHGASAYHPGEAALYRAMAQQSREKIVVVDHSKLGVVANHLFCPVSDVNHLITDMGATDETVQGFINKGIHVRRV